MPDDQFRILLLASHPIQYGAPFFRALSNHPRVDLTVAYCSLRGAQPGYDKEFGIDISWDVPLLDGYKWVHVPNCAFSRDEESFFGLCNPRLWTLIRAGEFDAVLSFVGYVRSSFWIAVLAAKVSGIPFLFGTDASSIIPRESRPWKRRFKLAGKLIIWRAVFRLADQVLTSSTPGREMMRGLGIPHERISMTPDTVDNDWWLAQSARVDRSALRNSLGFSRNEFVILFCGKLQPWKRPADLLRAFARASLPNARLVFAGEGPLRSFLEAEATSLGVRDRISFPGFVNQSQLPAMYKSADLMVLPSEYEPFGLVVNEAMLCDCAVLASDSVGAVQDLIDPGRTGFVYPCSDIEALAGALREIFTRWDSLFVVACAARERMQSWSYGEAIAGLMEAFDCAIARSSSRTRRSEAAPSKSVPPTAKSSVSTAKRP